MAEFEGRVDDAEIARLRSGDEAAFVRLVRAHQALLMQLALAYSPSREAAEEAVQETWIAVLDGLAGFQGRSALRTWICQIAIRTAQRRSTSERRVTPFGALVEDDGPVVAGTRFASHGPYSGHWSIAPPDTSALPEPAFLSREMREVVRNAIADLPENQRIVITLRDVEGWSTVEVRELLSIADGHQRILLHRARGRVRNALEPYLARVAGANVENFSH